MKNETTINNILFNTSRKWIIQNSSNKKNNDLKIKILALSAELLNLGFFMSNELKNNLEKLTYKSFSRAAKNILNAAKESSASHIKDAPPLFEDFPNIDITTIAQLQNSLHNNKYLTTQLSKFVEEDGWDIFSKIELLTNGSFVVVTKTNDKVELDKFAIKLKEIKLGKAQDVYDLFNNLVYSKVPLSKKQLEIIVALYNKNLKVDFSKIIQREIFAKIVAGSADKWLSFGSISAFSLFIDDYKKSSKDILRISAALSNSDIGLKDVMFSLNNWERLLIVQLIDKFSPKDINETKQNRNLWLKLLQTIHISSKKYKHYKNAQLFAEKIRSSKSYAVNENEEAIQNIISGNYVLVQNGLNFITKKPGLFLRNIDSIIRAIDKNYELLDFFKNRLQLVLEKADLKLIFPIYKFLLVNNDSGTRAFFPKGSFSKMILEKDYRVNTDQYFKIKAEVVETMLSSIMQKIKNDDFYGTAEKVYIAPELFNIIAPFSMKDMQPGTVLIPTGSVIDLDKSKNIFRLFCWWRETLDSSRVDVDLSIITMDNSFKRISELGWSNLHIEQNGLKHSGDETEAPINSNGSSEFIDINCDQLVNSDNRIRYVGVSLNVFTKQKFSAFECKAGFMERDESGGSYEPSTVKHQYDLIEKIQNTVPFLFDIINKKVIWINVALSSDQQTIRVDEKTKNSTTIEDVFKEINNFHLQKASVGEVLKTKAIASNIVLVDNEDDADVVFNEENFEIINFSKLL